MEYHQPPVEATDSGTNTPGDPHLPGASSLKTAPAVAEADIKGPAEMPEEGIMVAESMSGAIEAERGEMAG